MLGSVDFQIPENYLQTDCDGVRIFYPASLGIKEGHRHILVHLRGFLWWHWLELIGAKALPIIEK